MEDMDMDVKAENKITNQRCEKSFEKHTKRIDLHDTALKHNEVQMGKLTRVVQSENNAAFQGEKGYNS